MSSKKKLNSLQALRAIAAMLVCMCHLPFSLELYSTHFGLPYDDRLVLFDPWFNSGVDVFFVISGFVMTYVVSGRKIDFEFCRNFVLKRVLRIYPMYWAVLAAYGLYVFLFSGNAFKSVEQVFFSILLLPGYRVMPLSWTLTFEMLFYTIFTLAMFISIVRWKKTWLTVVLITFFYFGSFLLPEIQDTHSIFQSPIIYEFILGLILAKLFFKDLFLTRKLAFISLAIYFCGALWNVFDPMVYENTYSWSHFFRWGVSSALLVYAFLSLEHHGLTFPSLLLKIGDSSYSLYLLNSVLMVFFVKTWIKLDLPAVISSHFLWVVLAVYAITVSYWAYVLLEKPMVKASYNKFIYKRIDS